MNADAVSHETTHETYAQRIWRQFRADRFARNGLRIVVLLFIVAALAPFLANSHAHGPISGALIESAPYIGSRLR